MALEFFCYNSFFALGIVFTVGAMNIRSLLEVRVHLFLLICGPSPNLFGSPRELHDNKRLLLPTIPLIYQIIRRRIREEEDHPITTSYTVLHSY